MATASSLFFSRPPTNSFDIRMPISYRRYTGTASSDLDLEALIKFRERFPFHADADAFSLS